MHTPDSSQTKNTISGIAVAVAGEIPILGALVAAYSSAVGARQRERDEEFWSFVVSNQRITEDRVNAIAKGEDDRFVATAFRLVREARETVDSEKRQRLADLLVSSDKWARVSDSEREEMISILISLTTVETMVLGYLADPRGRLRELGMEANARSASNVGSRGKLMRRLLADDDSARYAELERAAASLERKGLAQPNLNTHMSATGVIDPSTTALGDRVLAFIGGQ